MPKLPSIIFGLAGWSGSGKTTLAEKLIHFPEEDIKLEQLSTLIINLKPI